MVNGPDIDKLGLNQLRRPMLTQLMTSMLMKAEVGAVANQIKDAWVARVPRETGNLANSAHVTYHRSTIWDRRWEAEFEAGGPQAPYVLAVEQEHHILAQVLEELGYFQHGARL